MPARRLAATLAFLLVFAGPCLAQVSGGSPLPTAGELLARHIRETGGNARWAATRTQTRKGVALPDLGSLPLETFAKAPAQWGFQLTLRDGGVLTHGFDGKQGWEQLGPPLKMTAAQTLEETIVYNPFWVLRFNDYFPKASVQAVQRNGKREVYVVEAFTAAGGVRTVNFDAKNGFLTRVGKVVFDDYREVNGVKVPFLVRVGWRTLKFTEIRHHTPVDNARFAVPAGLEAGPLPAVDEILEKYLDAVGGAAAVGRIRSEVRKGTLKHGNDIFQVETYASVPGRWLFVANLGSERIERQGCNGTTAWKQSSGIVKPMDSDDRDELSSFLDPQTPLKLKESGGTMKAVRKEVRGARGLYVLEAELPGGGSRQLAFDAQSGLLAQIGSVVLEDYRQVDGVKTAFVVRSQRGDTELRFSEITHGPVDESRFRKPAPGPAFQRVFAGLKDGQAVPVLKEAFGRVSPSDGRLLYDLIREKRYGRGLEVGTASGYCSAWFGLAMKENGGALTTIEIDPEVADVARENLRRAGLSGVVDLRVNDALLEIPVLFGDFDFVFLDPGVPLNKKLLDLVYRKVKPGGAIVAHDAENFRAEQPDFLKAIETDPKLVTRIVPTASGGLSISLKQPDSSPGRPTTPR